MENLHSQSTTRMVQKMWRRHQILIASQMLDLCPVICGTIISHSNPRDKWSTMRALSILQPHTDTSKSHDLHRHYF